ncbi:MAG: polysaccharide biosynthesis protein [Planctomycetota bacterium]
MQFAVLIGSPTTVADLLAQIHAHRDGPRIIPCGIILWNDSPEAPTSEQHPPSDTANGSGGSGTSEAMPPILGSLQGNADRLEDVLRLTPPRTSAAVSVSACAHSAPDIALISLPATMAGAVQRLRTTLRRLRIADRFVPTFEDLMNGVGPRTQLDLDPADLIGRRPHELEHEAIARAVTGKRVLITGAGGSIGSELARLVARFDPSALLLMDRSENALFEIDRQIARRHPDLKRRAWLHDVAVAARTRAYCLAAKPQVIFHAAAHKHVPLMEDHPALAVVNNVFGTRAIADAALETGCEHFVMISTDKAVRPTSVMGATKRIAELYVQQLNGLTDTRFSVVRFGNVIGSTGSVLPTWLDQIHEGGPVTVTDPEMTRFFMTIPEAAGLVLSAAALEDEITQDRGGEVRILDMGSPLRIVELAQRVIEAHGLVADLKTPRGAEAVNPDVTTPPPPRSDLTQAASKREYQSNRPGGPALGRETKPLDPTCVGGVFPGDRIASRHADPNSVRAAVDALFGIAPDSTDEQNCVSSTQSNGSATDRPESRRSTPGTSIEIIFTGIRPGEKLHEELSYDREQLAPTSHPGIHVWQSDPPPAEFVADAMATLSDAVTLALKQPTHATARHVIEELQNLLPEAELHQAAVTVAAGIDRTPADAAPGAAAAAAAAAAAVAAARDGRSRTMHSTSMGTTLSSSSSPPSPPLMSERFTLPETKNEDRSTPSSEAPDSNRPASAA